MPSAQNAASAVLTAMVAQAGFATETDNISNYIVRSVRCVRCVWLLYGSIMFNSYGTYGPMGTVRPSVPGILE